MWIKQNGLLLISKDYRKWAQSPIEHFQLEVHHLCLAGVQLSSRSLRGGGEIERRRRITWFFPPFLLQHLCSGLKLLLSQWWKGWILKVPGQYGNPTSGTLSTNVKHPCSFSHLKEITLPLGDRSPACGLNAGWNVLIYETFMVLLQQAHCGAQALSKTTALIKIRPSLQPHWTCTLIHYPVSLRLVCSLKSCVLINESFADCTLLWCLLAGAGGVVRTREEQHQLRGNLSRWKQSGFSGKQAVFIKAVLRKVKWLVTHWRFNGITWNQMLQTILSYRDGAVPVFLPLIIPTIASQRLPFIRTPRCCWGNHSLLGSRSWSHVSVFFFFLSLWLSSFIFFFPG